MTGLEGAGEGTRWGRSGELDFTPTTPSRRAETTRLGMEVALHALSYENLLYSHNTIKLLHLLFYGFIC